jgi:hypothetical protein
MRNPNDSNSLGVVVSQSLVPRITGKFSLYDTPDGGIHIAYQENPKSVDEDGTPVDEPVKHIELPGKAIRMAVMLENGANPAKLMRMMMGGGPLEFETAGTDS